MISQALRDLQYIQANFTRLQILAITDRIPERSDLMQWRKSRIMRAKELGLTPLQIAKLIGVSRNTVVDTIRRYEWQQMRHDRFEKLKEIAFGYHYRWQKIK
jgi:hypothetical protein